MSSLEITEKECAANAVAPRVTLDDIKEATAGHFTCTGLDVAKATGDDEGIPGVDLAHLGLVTICLLVMRNGFTVIGKSAPASPANYNKELGEKLAYEDAVRQVWPLMGFALRNKLTGY